MKKKPTTIGYLHKNMLVEQKVKGKWAYIYDAIDYNALDLDCYYSWKIENEDCNQEITLKNSQVILKILEDFERYPLSHRMFKDYHKKMFKDGQFRNLPVKVGKSETCPPEFLKAQMSELEYFINYGMDYIKLAMFHAEFESIHPFFDGNGRTGRAFIPVVCIYHKIKPVYLSEYFYNNQIKYYARLEKYRKGEIKEWVKFFLAGVKLQTELSKKESQYYYG